MRQRAAASFKVNCPAELAALSRVQPPETAGTMHCGKLCCLLRCAEGALLWLLNLRDAAVDQPAGLPAARRSKVVGSCCGRCRASGSDVKTASRSQSEGLYGTRIVVSNRCAVCE